jgi:hypothetical protein
MRSKVGFLGIGRYRIRGPDAGIPTYTTIHRPQRNDKSHYRRSATTTNLRLVFRQSGPYADQIGKRAGQLTGYLPRY